MRMLTPRELFRAQGFPGKLHHRPQAGRLADLQDRSGLKVRQQRLPADGGALVAPTGLAGDAADSEAGVTDDTRGEVDGAVIQTSDPVVAELLMAHRARKEFPAGHTFSMTNPTVNGRWMNLGTCTCGDTFSYPYGSAGYESMDAAIEAHWQKFDHLADKIDGMGHRIGSEAAPVPKPKRPRKRTKSDAPEGIPASNVANAGPQAASRSEPAPCATNASLRIRLRLRKFDDDDLSIEWPSYQTFLEDKIVTAPLRGIEVARDALHPWLKPHCKDLTVWALRLGCAAIFANFGLHKTAMQLEWCRQLVKHTGQPSLCVVPLGVRHGFIKEALQLGMDVRFIRTTAEMDELYCEGVRIS
jgi:hypothetical protein